jgi:N-methylhydantoinase A/oxoprolinase/acetone carboxylase beta subunit
VPAGTLGAGTLEAITAGFESAYRALYHRTPMGVAIEALNWRLVVSGSEPAVCGRFRSTISGGPDMAPALPQSADTPLPKRARKAYFPETGGYIETPVYDRYALAPGAAFAGPAIVEERESTTIIGPGARVRVDAWRTLVAEPA